MWAIGSADRRFLSWLLIAFGPLFVLGGFAAAFTDVGAVMLYLGMAMLLTGLLLWTPISPALALVVGITTFVALLGWLIAERAQDDAPTAGLGLETPGPTVQLESCPVQQPICDFALRVADWVRAGDVDALTRGSPGDSTVEGKRIVTTGLSGLGPLPNTARLVSIGCPILGGATMCSRGFSLVFSTFMPGEVDPGGFLGIVILGFANDADPPVITGVGFPSRPAERAAVLQGGRPESCALPAGLQPRTEAEECTFSDYMVVATR